MPENTTESTVALSSGHDRFEITTDDELAGFTEFIDRDGRRIFYHTEIGEEFGGRGLGRQLIDRALSDTRAAGMRIVPVCPFVKKYLEEHREFDDLVDAVTKDAIAAVRESTR